MYAAVIYAAWYISFFHVWGAYGTLVRHIDTTESQIQ